jgi:creatinine amidohydrolase/Fe(II)-dependent formamide hydrolase-like protein
LHPRRSQDELTCTRAEGHTPRSRRGILRTPILREAYEAVAEDVRWIAIGGSTTTGRQAVIDICESTSRELADTATDLVRFLIVDGGETVVVDSVARYSDATGAATQVASCNIYESRAGLITSITSHTVEIDPD